MWFYTATPQECSGCGGTDEMVNATTRRCLECDGADMVGLPRLQPQKRWPVALSPYVLATEQAGDLGDHLATMPGPTPGGPRPKIHQPPLRGA